jgi:hypothetical protein
VIRATAITQARRAIREESDTGAAPAILSRPRVGIPPHGGSPPPSPTCTGGRPSGQSANKRFWFRETNLGPIAGMTARTRFNQNGGSLIDPAPGSLAQHISDGTSRDKSTAPPRWSLHRSGQIDPNRPKRTLPRPYWPQVNRRNTDRQAENRCAAATQAYRSALPETTSGVITTLQRPPGLSTAHPRGSPQPQHRLEYRFLAVMCNAHTR